MKAYVLALIVCPVLAGHAQTPGDPTDGRHTEPGGGPLVDNPFNPLGSATPPSVLGIANPEQLSHLNVAQLEHARSASLLPARAYELALTVSTTLSRDDTTRE